MKKMFDISLLRKCFAIAALAVAGMFAVPVSMATPSEVGSQSVEVSAQPSVRVVDGHVEISLPGEEPRQVAVYSLTGQLVKSIVVQPGVTVIELAPGYYIVRCDRLSQRVIVR